ncbi:MAG: hypothetical protein FJ126_09110 [Deltaproteobacteria bacterium]|nr:hypothetical protein [Deltaproteobacteria bacterium]
MAEIKSALEMALERAERFGRASKEEMAEARHREQGQRLAVNFLKGEVDLEKELQAAPPEALPALKAGIKEVLLRNVALPRNGDPDPRLSLALEGLLLAATNPKAMARFKSEVEQLMTNFVQVRNNAFQQLKARFSATLGDYARALEMQLRQKVRLEVEHLPQFQEEWRKFLGQLQEQFEPLLEELKSRMKGA